MYEVERQRVAGGIRRLLWYGHKTGSWKTTGEKEQETGEKEQEMGEKEQEMGEKEQEKEKKEKESKERKRKKQSGFGQEKMAELAHIPFFFIFSSWKKSNFFKFSSS